ncbi:hypothetical protein SLEP1_g47105 [Rubroshorea leprosula]|uniref:Uncharacterized protein n=1 Tax=Rubroshorea leprosula TaxID=152421 RepID=A0AAV5LQA1_9ROSI|nr:hypothetical protein SLEP1_g47105 [Rubroshorea leprosula]
MSKRALREGQNNSSLVYDKVRKVKNVQYCGNWDLENYANNRYHVHILVLDNDPPSSPLYPPLLFQMELPQQPSIISYFCSSFQRVELPVTK